MSQSSVVLPTTGVVSGVTFAVGVNSALDAIRTSWSGSSAPSADVAEQGQFWLDTSAVSGGGFPILRQYDGASWVIICVIDTTNHQVLADFGTVNTTTGTGAAYALSTSPYNPTVLPRTGYQIQFEVHTPNTGACTLNVNALGAKPLRAATGVDFTANTLVAGSILTATYLNGSAEWVCDNVFAGASPIPPGVVSEYGGFSAPSGYLMADGSAQSRSTFAPLLAAITITQSGVLHSNTSVTGLSDTSQMQVGQSIESTHIPASTTIASIVSSSAITISQAATASTTENVQVFPWGNGNGSTTFNIVKRAGLIGVGRDNMSGSNAANSQIVQNLTTTASTSATVANGATLAIGMFINFSTVPFGTTITNISGNTITMSNSASGAAGPTAARFSPIPDANIVGQFGGELTHTQQLIELVTHNHTGTTGDDAPDHTHNYTGTTPSFSAVFAGGITIIEQNGATTGGANNKHQHPFTTANQGISQPANNTPKVVVMNFIVKT